MGVPAGKVLVKCKLRNDVGRNVGCANVVTSVGLDAKRRVDGKGEDGFTYANKLGASSRAILGWGIVVERAVMAGGGSCGRSPLICLAKEMSEEVGGANKPFMGAEKAFSKS